MTNHKENNVTKEELYKVMLKTGFTYKWQVEPEGDFTSYQVTVTDKESVDGILQLLEDSYDGDDLTITIDVDTNFSHVFVIVDGESVEGNSTHEILDDGLLYEIISKIVVKPNVKVKVCEI